MAAAGKFTYPSSFLFLTSARARTASLCLALWAVTFWQGFNTSTSASAASLPERVVYVSVDGIRAVDIGNSKKSILLYQNKSHEGTVSPRWSPNGVTLAFISVQSLDPVTVRIVLTDRNGKVIATPLKLNGTRQIGAIAWSPKGDQIAYFCSTGESIVIPPGQFDQPGAATDYAANICVLDIATGATRLLAASTENLLFVWGTGGNALSWSRDGNEIISAGVHSLTPCSENTDPYGGCGNAALIVADVASGTLHALLDQPVADGVFSPKGDKIAIWQFEASSAGAAGINIMSSAATGIRPFSSAQSAPTWSPDGKEILYRVCPKGQLFPCHFYRANIDGGPEKQVTPEDEFIDSVDASWAPSVTLCTVPELVGLTLTKATAAMKKTSCVLGKISGPTSMRNSRKVKSQKPTAKKIVGAGTPVDIKLK